MDTFLLVLDLAGTFVFALSGAMTGIRHKLDLFGVLVLSFAAANAGGITRDVLIGATPPAAIKDWRYIVVALVAGLITFYRYSLVNRLRSPVQIFDAAGLALFAVAGALKALNFHLNPVAAVVLGMLTGIGGGMLRDVVATEIPTVLRSELYAVAALAGAAVVVIGNEIHIQLAVASVAGAALCFGLRMAAVRRGWQLPVAPGAAHETRRGDALSDHEDDGTKRP